MHRNWYLSATLMELEKETKIMSWETVCSHNPELQDVSDITQENKTSSHMPWVKASVQCRSLKLLLVLLGLRFTLPLVAAAAASVCWSEQAYSKQSPVLQELYFQATVAGDRLKTYGYSVTDRIQAPNYQGTLDVAIRMLMSPCTSLCPHPSSPIPVHLFTFTQNRTILYTGLWRNLQSVREQTSPEYEFSMS